MATYQNFLYLKRIGIFGRNVVNLFEKCFARNVEENFDCLWKHFLLIEYVESHKVTYCIVDHISYPFHVVIMSKAAVYFSIVANIFIALLKSSEHTWAGHLPHRVRWVYVRNTSVVPCWNLREAATVVRPGKLRLRNKCAEVFITRNGRAPIIQPLAGGRVCERTCKSGWTCARLCEILTLLGRFACPNFITIRINGAVTLFFKFFVHHKICLTNCT